MIRIQEIPALGTRWWFDLFDAEASREQELTDLITGRLRTFEERYSRFSDTSLVGILNRTKILENPSDDFISLLLFGQQLYTDTDGVFNFLSAHIQTARGYGTSVSDDTAPADPTVDLIIGEDAVTLGRGAVDLGGFGKGWLIDDIASLLRASGLHHFLINGGGDIYASTHPDGSPVAILVEHPTEEKRFIAEVPLINQGFAGSGTHKRQWRSGGKEHHHIIARHTYPIAAHVIADTALTADVFATFACAMEPAYAPRMLADRNLEYLLIHRGAFACSEAFRGYFLGTDGGFPQL